VKDQIALFQAAAVLGGIRIFLRTNGQMQANTAYTPANMRRVAAQITGKGPYPRSRKGLEQAGRDLEVKVLEMKVALDQASQEAGERS
jgi:hypothetical protein